MEAFYSHFKWAGIITEAQWVSPVLLQTQDFPCSVAIEKQTQLENDYRTGEVSRGPVDHEAGRAVLN